MSSSTISSPVETPHPACSVVTASDKTRKRLTWKDRIIRMLGSEKATTRMLANMLDCQTCDISSAMLALRKTGRIEYAGLGRDPYSKHLARFWCLAYPAIAARPTDEDA